jgi:hypothetical protein
MLSFYDYTLLMEDGITTYFANRPSEWFYRFLTGVIKKSFGHFMDEDFDKYNKLKDEFANFVDDYGGGRSNEENLTTNNGVDEIKFPLSHTIEGSFGGYGQGGWSKRGNTTCTFFVDSKGIVKEIKASGQKRITKKVIFERKNDIPPPVSKKDVDFSFQPGQKADNVDVIFKGWFDSKYSRAYKFAMGEEELISFDVDWGEIGKQIGREYGWHPAVGDFINMNFQVKKLDVYQGKKSITITNVKINNYKPERYETIKKDMEDTIDKIRKKYSDSLPEIILKLIDFAIDWFNKDALSWYSSKDMIMREIEK